MEESGIVLGLLGRAVSAENADEAAGWVSAAKEALEVIGGLPNDEQIACPFCDDALPPLEIAMEDYRAWVEKKRK